MVLFFQIHKLRAPQEVLPDCYSKYFANPVSFNSLAERIKNHVFNSADEFLSEVKWMQHNALILDSGGGWHEFLYFLERIIRCIHWQMSKWSKLLRQ